MAHSKLQIANQQRWNEEGSIKRTCAAMRQLLDSKRDKIFKEDYDDAMKMIDDIELTLIQGEREKYERIKHGLKTASRSSKEVTAK